MNNSEIQKNSTSSQEEHEEFTFQDNSQGFELEYSTNQKTLSKIQEAKLKLSPNDVFKGQSTLSKLTRKNHIFYFVRYAEKSVEITETQGKNYLPLITRQEIKNNLDKIKNEKIRSTISDINFGAIKILIKSRFRQGINSPIKMALIDDRINDRQDSILGAAHGNLAYQKFMFTVYPKFTTSINDKKLDQTLAFIHRFERQSFMKEGNFPFSITYCVAYALSNSHHSIDYKEKDSIEIDNIFSEIGSVKQSTFMTPDPEPNNWALDIATNKNPIGFKPKPKVSNNLLQFSKNETSTSHQNDPSNDQLAAIANKINVLVKKIDGMNQQ
ncbi:movement protein [Silene caulimovirus A]|nr:movement protein [Silene caulimovirus A]